MSIDKHNKNDFTHLFPELTELQYLVIHQYSTGYSTKVIAMNMTCTIDNVNAHLKALRKKLACNSSSDLRTIYLNRVMGAIAMSMCVDLPIT
ncbi:helix-turn-helix transcriptional regulator [Vibrio tapetis]|uniref:helix-turn-helix transcriptional regulator n=1 Tax=Vibrio tapetis TaxID=52443 RepID=UPI00338E6495